MKRASCHARREWRDAALRFLNANWLPATNEGDGKFEVLIITEDAQPHAGPASPASMTALVALAKAKTVMAWDPTIRPLIVANIVETMPYTVAGTS
jgi:hypothetical protein